jgi:hypothetical protein
MQQKQIANRFGKSSNVGSNNEQTIVDIFLDEKKEPRVQSILKKANALQVYFNWVRKLIGEKTKLFVQLLLLLWILNSILKKFQYTDNEDHRFQHMRNDMCHEDGVNYYTEEKAEVVP